MTDWSKRAEGYDRLGWVRDPSSTAALEAVLAQVMERRRASLLTERERQETPFVADLGCGTGAVLEVLSRMGCAGIGVDSSAAMLARCKPPIPFVLQQADAATWPCLGPLDLVTARMLLHHMPEPRAALATWMAMLAVGGALVIFESVLPTDGKLDAANDLCIRALSLKEPGRHFFTPWDIARMMPSPHVEVVIWTTERNSLLNWLDSDPSLAPDVRTEIVRLHCEAAEDPAVREAYAMEFEGDDILMRWRHCAVVGWKP